MASHNAIAQLGLPARCSQPIVQGLADASKHQECSLCTLGARDLLPPDLRMVVKATRPSRFGVEGFVFLGAHETR